MSFTNKQKSDLRKTQIETLEQRMMMTADALTELSSGSAQTLEVHSTFQTEDVQEILPTADFWQDYKLDTTAGGVHRATAAATPSGLDRIREKYGFKGSTQTVVVIDSGIAYDHVALGGGFGSNYRVVGGFDFTGNTDTDPYDSGAAGAHGTHVSGIIGSSDATHTGVAPDVDLVGLRVFDDAGNGNFGWVEDALRWVHANKDRFENPITTINMSLGTHWNSESLPQWANLEDELAQLKADGIFIAVSAGNSFADFNTPGLSYPAASDYVVPVMSVDDSGMLSYFSQRSESGIAAPGRYINSTIPDLAGNRNGLADDFARMSGTSMAAPYVAGASVLIREAMEFIGHTNVTQDQIYSHMLSTADALTDAVSGITYKSLNIESAIEALMPTDDFGSEIATAHNWGSLQDGQSFSGAINTLNDIDYFTFTATDTGTVSFSNTNSSNINSTHGVNTTWNMAGKSHSGEYTLEVVAGQSYTLGVASNSGIGSYTINVEVQSVAVTAIDLGTITQGTLAHRSNQSETWYKVVASQNGIFTTEAFFSNAQGDMNLSLYDSTQNNLLGSSNSTSDNERLDVTVEAGKTYYVSVTGTNQAVELRLTNLVSISGDQVTVHGTSQDDNFAFTAGSEHTVNVNGVRYQFSAEVVSKISFAADTGNDTIVLTGSDAMESAHLRVGSVSLRSATYKVNATGVENITVNGAGGSNSVHLYDSVGEDTFESSSNHASMTGENFSNTANGFSYIYGYSNSGNDTAVQHGSNADTTLTLTDQRSILSEADSMSYARGFKTVNADAGNGGENHASLYDSTGNDLYESHRDYVRMSGKNFTNTATGFDNTEAFATAGNDIAHSYDTAGDDIYQTFSDRVVMFGEGYANSAHGFDQTVGYASEGTDQSYSFDSSGDDVYSATGTTVTLRGAGYSNVSSGFDKNFAFASSGNDTATFNGTEADELFKYASNRASMSSTGYYNQATGFDQVSASAGGGNDTAWMKGSSGVDLFESWEDRSTLTGDHYSAAIEGFDYLTGFGGAEDQAIFHGTTSAEHLSVDSLGITIEKENQSRKAKGFGQASAESHGGDDTSDVEAVDYNFSLIGDWG